ncbi:4-hydroxythreonine-4-phosphate dehydrogenase PdxA [Rhizobium sp. SGZ-381]|uniref:4-hydroxythreonine-4-phosphate dehydrogenase PdxA n=1 Tax=Rhizobium sp. SGZ-381 TaxID=3342800 RepID=UPI00366C64F9
MTVKTIAITMGDPAGIGPEICLKAAQFLSERLQRESLRLLIVGNPEILSRTGTALDLPVPTVTSLDALEDASVTAILPVPAAAAVQTGCIGAEGGRQAYEAVRIAVELALAGRISAIVTAPLNKEAMHLAGYHYAGHTELLTELTGSSGGVMMLAHDAFRVTHVTTHCALEDVPRRATADRIGRVIELTHEALVSLGIKRPRIAVAALNPHAGEGGAFGRHDIDITTPVIESWRARGHDVEGPVAGDTVFVKLRAGQYDAVVAMYHDQGHIPVKLLGFQVDPKTGQWVGLSGVNITLGLPIIRTSVDHGTAFDIAGKGIAHASSLVEAIDYAVKLAR